MFKKSEYKKMVKRINKATTKEELYELRNRINILWFSENKISCDEALKLDCMINDKIFSLPLVF